MYNHACIICVYVCMYVCMHVRILHVFMFVFMNESKNVHACRYVSECKFMYTCSYIYVCLCVMCVQVCIHAWNVWIYLCIHVFMHA
jgi:hypothetical protein